MFRTLQSLQTVIQIAGDNDQCIPVASSFIGQGYPVAVDCTMEHFDIRFIQPHFHDSQCNVLFVPELAQSKLLGRQLVSFGFYGIPQPNGTPKCYRVMRVASEKVSEYWLGLSLIHACTVGESIMASGFDDERVANLAFEKRLADSGQTDQPFDQEIAQVQQKSDLLIYRLLNKKTNGLLAIAEESFALKATADREGTPTMRTFLAVSDLSDFIFSQFVTELGAPISDRENVARRDMLRSAILSKNFSFEKSLPAIHSIVEAHNNPFFQKRPVD